MTPLGVRDRRLRRDAAARPGGRRPGFIRPGYLVWIVLPVLLIGGYLAFGLPYVIWSYDWRPPGPNSYSDFSERHYTRCSYLGPYGLITEYPRDGTCGWVRFSKSSETGREERQ